VAACAGCSEETERDKAFEMGEGRLLCPKCFVERAQSKKSLTGEDRRRLKEAVKQELAGLLPRDRIRDILEECYTNILKGSDLDEEVGRATNEIERVAGLALCKELLSMLGGISKALEDEDAEVREKIRRIGSL